MAFLQPDEYSMDFVQRNLTQGQVQTNFNENASSAFDHALNNVAYSANKWFYNSNHSDIAEEQASRMRPYKMDIPTIRDMNRENGFGDATPLIDKFNLAVDELRRTQPDKEWLKYNEIADRAKQKTIDDANQAEHTWKDISSRSSTGGAIGSMVGFLAGSMADPINMGVMLATAPFTLETLPMAIFGNALINTGTETASQFLPGGQRDWARERGLSPEQVDDETKSALLMAPVGGAVFGGVLHGGSKALGAVVNRLVGDPNPLAQRAAADALTGLGGKLSQEARDGLAVLNSVHRLEDVSAGDGLSSRLTGVDQVALRKNLSDLNAISELLTRGGETPDLLKGKVDWAHQALEQRVVILDNIIDGIKTGKATPDDIASVIRLLPDEAQDRFNGRVRELKNESSSRLDTLANAERLIEEGKTARTKVESESVTNVGQLERMKEVQSRLSKELDDHQSVMNELTAKKSELERNIVDLHEGKFGDIKDQVPDIHNDFRKQLAQVEKDIASFAPEMDKASKAVSDFQVKMDKAERRASRDVESRKAQVDAETNRKITEANDTANTSNRAELNTAKEALIEQRMIDENKRAYVEMFSSNPKVDPSRIRELVGFREMMERKSNGELIGEEDFLNALRVEERAKLEKILDKSATSEEGLNKYFNSAKKRIKEDGIANIEHIAKNIDSIMESFGKDVKFRDVIEAMKEGNNSPPAVIDYKAVTKDIEAHDAIINSDLNTEMAHPITGDKTTAKAIGQEIDHKEWVADFLDNCGKGGA